MDVKKPLPPRDNPIAVNNNNNNNYYYYYYYYVTGFEGRGRFIYNIQVFRQKTGRRNIIKRMFLTCL